MQLLLYIRCGMQQETSTNWYKLYKKQLKMTVVQLLSRYQCIVADVANTTQASQCTNAAVIL